MGEINGWGADPPVKDAVEVVGTLVISETCKVFDAINRTKNRVFGSHAGLKLLYM